MSQEITGDPVTNLGAWSEGRYVFTSQEDNIAALLNDNIRKTVDLQEEFESEISTLQSEMNTAQSNISDNDSDISSLQSTVSGKLEEERYDRLVSALQVCELQNPQASTVNTVTLDVTAIKMPLLDGDQLVHFDPSGVSTGLGSTSPTDGAVQTLTITADAAKNSSQIEVSGVDKDLEVGDILLLDKASIRDGDTAGAVNDYLSNLSTHSGLGSTTGQNQDPVDFNLSQLAQDVRTLGVKLTGDPADDNDNGLEGQVESLSTDLDGISTQTNTIQGELQSVRSSVNTLENEAVLGVTSRAATDQEIAKLDTGNFDGNQSGTTDLPVDNVTARLKAGDHLMAYNDTAGKSHLLEIDNIEGKDEWPPVVEQDTAPSASDYHSDSTWHGGEVWIDTSTDPATKKWYDTDSGSFVTSRPNYSITITLKSQHQLNLPEDSLIFLAPISIRSEVSVVKDEVNLRVKKGEMVSELSVQLDNITTKTDVFRSDSFPSGAVDRSGSLAGFDESYTFGDSEKGWALFENGEFSAVKGFFQGFVEAEKGRFLSGISLPDGSMISDPNRTFAISSSGMDIWAPASSTVNPNQFFGLRSESDDSLIGGLTGKLDPQERIILDATMNDASLVARARKNAELKSLGQNVVLGAQAGSVRVQSDEMIHEGIPKANGISDLEDNIYGGSQPPENLIWADTSMSVSGSGSAYMLRVYERSSNPDEGTKKADFTATALQLSIFVSDSSIIEGVTIDSYEWSLIDSGTTITTKSGAYLSSTPFNVSSAGDYDIQLTLTLSNQTTESVTKTVTVENKDHIPPGEEILPE